MGDLTRHFSSKEFECPCCGLENISRETVAMLEEARKYAGIPFKITSGSRCEKHNKKVGGKKTSSHLVVAKQESYAVDIAYGDSFMRGEILKSLYEAGFKRIGIAVTFIHADTDPYKPPATWLYK